MLTRDSLITAWWSLGLEFLWPEIVITMVGVTAVLLGILVAKAVSGALFRGLLAVVPLTLVGLVLCKMGAHSDIPLIYLGLLLVPTALLIHPITGRYIGEPGTWAVFWLLQGVYYVLLFGLIGQLRRRARS